MGLYLLQYKDKRKRGVTTLSMDHAAWSMVQDIITERNNMNKQIKKEFLPGGERRQELLDQVPEYLKAPGT